jgi:hypothetical protein
MQPTKQQLENIKGACGFTIDKTRDQMLLLTEVGSRYTVKKVIDFPVPSRDVTYQALPVRE